MTMVGVFIADDGMSFIGDGRVNSMEGEIISDTQVKLFELSPLCVLLPANGASDNIDHIMTTLRVLYQREGIQSVDRIATRFLEYCKEYVEISENTSIMPLFTLAGYNYLASGGYVAQVFFIKYEQQDWQVYLLNQDESKFVINSPQRQGIEGYVIDQYPQRSHDLEGMNQLAIDTLRLSEFNASRSVGGRTTLWNLQPPNPIQRVTPQKISALKRRSAITESNSSLESI